VPLLQRLDDLLLVQAPRPGPQIGTLYLDARFPQGTSPAAEMPSGCLPQTPVATLAARGFETVPAATQGTNLLHDPFSTVVLFGTHPTQADSGVSQGRLPSAEMLAGRLVEAGQILEHRLFRQTLLLEFTFHDAADYGFA
jgi:hypothetical protein